MVMMTNIGRKILLLTIIVAGVFLVSAIATYAVIRAGNIRDLSLIAKALITGGIIAGSTLPVLAWLALRPAALNQYDGYALEEIVISEDEVTEAIGNWIYAKHRRRTEDAVQFLEDDDGSISCRVTVRKN